MIPAVRRAVPLLLLVGLPELAAQGPTLSPAQSEANRLYQARDWPAAARAYDALVKEAPGNPTWRYRPGVSLLGLGKPGDALVALAPASQAQGPLGGLVFFGMARAEARLGEKDRAFEALKKASAAGFAQVSLLESEPDLAALRLDARFKEVIAGADRNARPCVYRLESHAFDFWVGDWDVTTSAGPAGTSHVERILGNLFFAGGGVPAGQTQPVTNRMTFFKVGPDEVRQLIEQSSDGGQTWNVSFDGAYKRVGKVKATPDSAPTAPRASP
jgi:hypothetical protein